MQDQVDAAEASNDAQLARALQSMQDTLPEGLQVFVVISGCNETAKQMVSHSSSCHCCKRPASCAASWAASTPSCSLADNPCSQAYRLNITSDQPCAWPAVPVRRCLQRLQASLESGALQTAPDLRGGPSGDQEAVQKLQLKRQLASLQEVCPIMFRCWDFMV